MKINIINQNSELDFAIKKIGGKLFLEECDDGIKILVLKITKGLAIKKSKDEDLITIGYASIPDFCRAMSIFVACGGDVKDDIIEESCFDELGLMLDNSRNAVATVETLEKFAINLALMGYNQLLLYTEDTYEVDNQPYFGYMRGRFSNDELKYLDNFCSGLGVELVPCIQTLAHINQITRYERYDKIIDCNDILLVGEEETYKLIEDMFSTIAKCFKSRKVNIGMDEAHMLGLGKFLDKFGYKKRYDIMVGHLKRVKEIAVKYGFKIQMWSDMFFRLLWNGAYYSDRIETMPKEIIDIIDKDITLIYWDYYSLEYERYDKMIKNHFALTDNVSFAGGAWKWFGLVPDNDFSNRANEQSIKACKDNGLKRFLLTSWGDNGAEASHFSVLPCLFKTANLAYNSDDQRAFKNIAGISFSEFMQIDMANKIVVTNEVQRANPSKFMLYSDALQGTFDSIIPKDIEKIYFQIAEKLKVIANQDFEYAYLFNSCFLLSKVLITKANLSIKIKDAYDAKAMDILENIAKDTIPLTIDAINEFYVAFKYQWNRENKAFGFEVQAIRIGGLIRRLQDIKEIILDFVNGKIKKIDECEEKRLPLGYFENVPPEMASFNSWACNVTTSIIG